jgi:hypothetical protein
MIPVMIAMAFDAIIACVSSLLGWTVAFQARLDSWEQYVFAVRRSTGIRAVQFVASIRVGVTDSALKESVRGVIEDSVLQPDRLHAGSLHFQFCQPVREKRLGRRLKEMA